MPDQRRPTRQGKTGAAVSAQAVPDVAGSRAQRTPSAPIAVPVK